MNVQGTWSVRYAIKQSGVFVNESGEDDEIGTVELKNGRVTGHDPFGGRYEGSYALEDSTITARVQVKSDDSEDPFIFDGVPNPFHLDLTGRYTSPDYFSMTGKVVENAELEIVLNCSRQGAERTTPELSKPPEMKSMTKKAGPYLGKSLREIVDPLDLNTKTLKNLFAVLKARSDAAAEMSATSVTRLDGQSEEDVERLRDDMRIACRLKVFITTNEGDVYSSYDESIFDDAMISSSRRLIVFDSSPDYVTYVKSRPQNWFRLELDLTKPVIFDLNLSPSEPTPNGSNLVLEGADDNWATNSLQRIKTALRESRIGWPRALLHRRNVFDLYVFFITIPAIFLILSRIESLLLWWFSQLTALQYFLFFAFLFLLLANVFRIFFNYTRWEFPYIEFDSGRGHKSLTRGVWTIILLALASGVVWAVAVNIWNWLTQNRATP